jgi:membrane-anchored protein YejM (alkaline phosphatase superfamily)
MLLLPLARWKHGNLRPLLLFCYGLVFSLLPISVALEVQGYRIGGSRYLYFLFPALCSLFLLSLLILTGWAARALGLLRIPRRGAFTLAALLVFSPLAGHAVFQQWRDISIKLFFEPDFFVRPFFGLKAPATCPESFGELRGLHNTVDIRELRKRCMRTGME